MYAWLRIYFLRFVKKLPILFNFYFRPIKSYICLHKRIIIIILLILLILYVEFAAAPLFFDLADYYSFLGIPLDYDKFIAGYGDDEVADKIFGFNSEEVAGKISGYSSLHFFGARTFYYFIYALCIVPAIFHFFIYFC